MGPHGIFFTLPAGITLLLACVLAVVFGLALLLSRLSRVPTSEAQTQREAATLRMAQRAQVLR